MVGCDGSNSRAQAEEPASRYRRPHPWSEEPALKRKRCLVDLRSCFFVKQSERNRKIAALGTRHLMPNISWLSSASFAEVMGATEPAESSSGNAARFNRFKSSISHSGSSRCSLGRGSKLGSSWSSFGKLASRNAGGSVIRYGNSVPTVAVSQ